MMWCNSFIAVSGLSSHPFGSWKERGGTFMWLRDSLAANPKGARVLLYGYDTTLVRSESFQDIDDISSKFALAVKQLRAPHGGSKSPPRPIVFIAHSLGGLIVKHAIHQMALTDTTSFRSIYALLFFGVPNRGLAMSHWLPIVSNQPNEGLIRNLEPGSNYLRSLQRRFDSIFAFPDSRIVSVYETAMSKTAKEEKPGVWKLTGPEQLLVPIASAVDLCPRGPRHSKLAIHQNHGDLPKFKGPRDSDYRHIQDFVDEFRREAVAVVQRRF